MPGKYLNPKYARRARRRRRWALTLAGLTICFCGLCALYSVDVSIRAAMLPAAPPLAELEELRPDYYRLTLFGNVTELSTQWIGQLEGQFQALLRTPSAPVRLFFQLRGAVTGQLPRNLRDDPQKAAY